VEDSITPPETCPCGCGGDFSLDCVRCKNDFRTRGNPFGAILISLTPVADHNGGHVSYTGMLCDECARYVIEEINPALKTDVAYQATLDQYHAAVRDSKGDS
jgi:hypothetical protein